MKIIAGELSVIPTKKVDITLQQILDEFNIINRIELNSFLKKEYFNGFVFSNNKELVEEDYIVNKETKFFHTTGILPEEKVLLYYSNKDNFDDFFTAIDFISGNNFFSEDLLDELSSKAQMLNEKFDFKFRHGSSEVGLLCLTMYVVKRNWTELARS